MFPISHGEGEGISMEINSRTLESFSIPRKFDIDGKCYFGEGFYSYVFFDGLVATKIFRIGKGVSEEHVREAFHDEVKAYTLAQSSADVIAITPRFFGPVKFKKIINNPLPYEQSLAPRAEILLWDCAYQIEYVSECFKKLSETSYYEDVKQKFYKVGINYIQDSSIAITNEDPLKIYVIDFGIEASNL